MVKGYLNRDDFEKKDMSTAALSPYSCDSCVFSVRSKSKYANLCILKNGRIFDETEIDCRKAYFVEKENKEDIW